jgi:hypothetical protein
MLGRSADGDLWRRCGGFNSDTHTHIRCQDTEDIGQTSSNHSLGSDSLGTFPLSLEALATTLRFLYSKVSLIRQTMHRFHVSASPCTCCLYVNSVP